MITYPSPIVPSAEAISGYASLEFAQVAQAAGVVAIEADPEHIHRLFWEMRSIPGASVPPSIEHTAFIMRWAGRRTPHIPHDSFFVDAPDSQLFVPFSALGNLQSQSVEKLGEKKQIIEAAHNDVIELDITSMLVPNFGYRLAQALAQLEATLEDPIDSPEAEDLNRPEKGFEILDNDYARTSFKLHFANMRALVIHRKAFQIRTAQ